MEGICDMWPEPRQELQESAVHRRHSQEELICPLRCYPVWLSQE